MSLLQSALNKLRGEENAKTAKPAASPSPEPAAIPPADQAEMTQRFAQFVMMQAQQVMMMLGLTPSPYGQMPPQLQEAKLFIDQLEMLVLKTKGNLTKQEVALLAKILEQCNMAFTKVSGGTPPSLMPKHSMQEIPLDEIVGPMEEDEAEEAHAPAPAPVKAEAPKSSPQAAAPSKGEASADAEGKKKYVKSYGSF